MGKIGHIAKMIFFLSFVNAAEKGKIRRQYDYGLFKRLSFPALLSCIRQAF